MDEMFKGVGQDLSGFRDSFSSSVCIVDCDTVGGNDFSTRFERVDVGVAEVYRYHGQSLRSATRSLRHIQSNPVDDFLILLPVNIPFEVVQLGNRAVIEPGSFVFLKTSSPFEGFCGRPPEQLYSELKIKVSGAVLRQKVPHLDQCCAVPVAAQDGAGGIMKSLVESIIDQGPFLSKVQARMFGSVLLNTIGIAALDAPELMGMTGSSRELSHARVRLMAHEFIECHLSNPQLDCNMVARHCRVSLRHLHASFDSSASAVGALIRELRLQRCREALLNPLMRNQSIIQIAMKWGYGSSASFTRAYRDRFGKSPSEERQVLVSGQYRH